MDRGGWDKAMKQNYANKTREECKVDCEAQVKEQNAKCKVQGEQAGEEEAC